VILVCPCGASLPEIEPGGHVRAGGVSVMFRRHTDFVICPGCLATYGVGDLRQGLVLERSLREMKLLHVLATR